MPTADLSPELALLGRERLSVLRDAIRALPLQQQVYVATRLSRVSGRVQPAYSTVKFAIIPMSSCSSL
jgi:hypothetical protein